mgnify:CR=1 FL=1
MTHYKMDRAQRAKQFAPFDALNGFNEALRAKEKITVPKVELTEDRKEEIDYFLHHLNMKKNITVIYYDGENYIKLTGMVTKIDPQNQVLTIVNTKIAFADIKDIREE